MKPKPNLCNTRASVRHTNANKTQIFTRSCSREFGGPGICTVFTKKLLSVLAYALCRTNSPLDGCLPSHRQTLGKLLWPGLENDLTDVRRSICRRLSASCGARTDLSSRGDWLFQKAGVMQVIRSAVLNESRVGVGNLLEYSVPSRLFQTFGRSASRNALCKRYLTLTMLDDR